MDFNAHCEQRVNQHLVLPPPPPFQPIHSANSSQEALGVGSLTVRRRERGWNDGWMHGRKEGRKGEWESWELAGTARLLFSFHSSFAHHVFRRRPEQFVVCVFTLRPSLFPPMVFESFSSWVQFRSFRVTVPVCMLVSPPVLCACVCVCPVNTHTHAHKHMQAASGP